MVPELPVLRMAVRRRGSTAVLELAGEADIATEARLRMRVRDVLSAPQVTCVVVDLRELAFLDLSALDVLLEASDDLRARGGSLVLRAPVRRVRRLLDVVGAAERLPVEP